jgi:hypothetical protein
MAAWERQQKELARQTEMISRLSGGGQAGRAEAAKKAMEKMKTEGSLVKKPFIEKKRRFEFPDMGKSGRIVARCENLVRVRGSAGLFGAPLAVLFVGAQPPTVLTTPAVARLRRQVVVHGRQLASGGGRARGIRRAQWLWQVHLPATAAGPGEARQRLGAARRPPGEGPWPRAPRLLLTCLNPHLSGPIPSPDSWAGDSAGGAQLLLTEPSGDARPQPDGAGDAGAVGLQQAHQRAENAAGPLHVPSAPSLSLCLPSHRIACRQTPDSGVPWAPRADGGG